MHYLRHFDKRVWDKLKPWIPGVRPHKIGKTLFLKAPDHALVTLKALGCDSYLLDGWVQEENLLKCPLGLIEQRLSQSELHPHIWDDWLLPFQKEGIEVVAQAGGGLLLWKPGGGKTAGAIVSALTVPWHPRPGTRNILTVTKAAVRYRWGREVEKLTTLRPWISDPDDRRRSKWESLNQYILKCWATGTRAWVIVGWEELASLVYGSLAFMVEGTTEERQHLALEADPTDELRQALRHVSGVGPKMSDMILDAFGSIEDFQQGDPQRIADLPGIGNHALSRLLMARPFLTPAIKLEQVHETFVRTQFDLLIMDELHTGKSRRREEWLENLDGKLVAHSRRNMVAAAKFLSGRAKWRLGTTATFIPNRLRDAWGQLDLLAPGDFGPYWPFAHRYCDAQEGAYAMDDSGFSNEVELAWRMGLTDQYGQRVIEDDGTLHPQRRPQWAFSSQVPAKLSHGELPAKRRSVEVLGFSSQASGDRDAWSDIRRADGAQGRMEAALEWACTKKRPWIISRVTGESAGGAKGVVFTGRIKDAERTHKALAEKLNIKLWLATGHHTTQERDQMAQEFMAHPGPCCLVATGYSMGTGIDLHDADYLIMAMLPLTPEVLEQWEGRVSRQGQKRPVVVIYPVAEGTVDEHVSDLLLEKLPAVVAITGQEELNQAAEDLSGIIDTDAILDGILARFCRSEEESQGL